MGCTTCGRSSKVSASAIQKVQSVEADPNCPFTIEQITIWLEKVKCVMSGGLYTQIPNTTKKQVNSYVSYLLSAKNYASKPCYFEKELEEIESFITVLTALNICTNN